MELFAIAIVGIVPLREFPEHQSEMGSQVLFGETMRILKKQDFWLQVMLDFDGTCGWVDIRQCALLPVEEYDTIVKSPKIIFDSLTEIVVNNNTIPLRVMLGSELYQNTSVPGTMKIRTNQYRIKQRIQTPIKGNIRHAVVEKARQYLYTPYLWGGRSLFGIDCSALTQIVFKQNGITLPREVQDQFSVGRLVQQSHTVMPGDIAFMKNAEGIVCHVGIMIDESSLIHADAWVRMAHVHDNKIINEDGTSLYSLAYVKNVID